MIKPTYKRSIPKRTDDNDNSMSIWDHCQVGADPRRISSARKKSSTHNKVDLRAHMAPHKEIDVYKVLLRNFKIFQNFSFRFKPDTHFTRNPHVTRSTFHNVYKLPFFIFIFATRTHLFFTFSLNFFFDLDMKARFRLVTWHYAWMLSLVLGFFNIFFFGKAKTRLL